MNDHSQNARVWGVEPGFHDVFGTWRDAHPEVQETIAKALAQGRSSPAEFSSGTVVTKAFQGERDRVWGITLQLYSVRSPTNWGIGDFRDLKRVIAIAAELGAGAIGLNPLHALRSDKLDSPSPYAPDSRLFLNWLYIDLEALSDLSKSALKPYVARGRALRETEFVDYERVAELKEDALRLVYKNFKKRKDQSRDFDAFRENQGDALARFAAFQVLRARYRGHWRDWPAPWRQPSEADLAAFRKENAEEIGFHEYVQWLAAAQLGECRELARQKGLAIGLYLDLAVGVDPAGADAWSFQDNVISELSIGAPPDEFNPGGQNWGLAPFNPHALPDNNFGIFRALVKSAMRYAGAVRLDHVVGLMRLYVIPADANGRGGAYIRYPFESLLSVIAEESQNYRCIFIGEDLGTVPEGFRETASRFGIWSYRVMLFERGEGGSFLPPERYPEQALATFNTHDLPTYRGWIEKHDLAVKHELGIDPGESIEARERSLVALRQALGGEERTQDINAACAFLARTPSRLVMVSIEDLLGEREQVNIPSTVNEHPNWRRKLPVEIEEWQYQALMARVAASFREAGRG